MNPKNLLGGNVLTPQMAKTGPVRNENEVCNIKDSRMLLLVNTTFVLVPSFVFFVESTKKEKGNARGPHEPRPHVSPGPSALRRRSESSAPPEKKRTDKKRKSKRSHSDGEYSDNSDHSDSELIKTSSLTDEE